MGKFMRKAKITRDVAALTDSSHFSIGVRTRAKTLALQKLQFAASPPPNPNLSYLELRSRKLEKPQLISNPRPSPRPSSPVLNSAESRSPSIRASVKKNEGETVCNFAENNLELADRERTRETTPIQDSASVGINRTPGSSTGRSRRRVTSRRIRNTNRNRNRNIPAALELDEFFDIAEQQEQRIFMAKWNFDVVNDVPLEGRYEWISMY